MHNYFFELIRVALNHSFSLSSIPSSEEWQNVFSLAEKQALLGICFYGFKQLPKEQTVNMPMSLKMRWLGIVASIQYRNELMNERCLNLQKRFLALGFESCILKGQGIAAIYDDDLSLLRQSGDIDVWVKGGLDSIKVLSGKLNQRMKVTEQHADFTFFDDVEVEVHFVPSMLRNPLVNERLQSWFKKIENEQFANCAAGGLCVPTLEFNLVFLIIHTYRHLFGEGVGLRQVMDYYMLLCSRPISAEVKQKTKKTLMSLNIYEFAAGLMWVICKVFSLSEEKMLFEPNQKHGEFLLNEIMRAGNMGKYDERLTSIRQSSSLKRFIMMNAHTFRLFKYYPQETLFAPFTRMYIWIWRKCNGWL